MQPFHKALACAEGYLQLGLIEEALAELDGLPGFDRLNPDCLQLEVAILLRARKWLKALACSEELIRRAPHSHHGYLHASFCLHELGRTVEARDRLLAAPDFVSEQALFFYNLACYEAQLENPDEAASLLRIAFRRDGALCKIALADRDLEPLREMVKSLVQRLEKPSSLDDPPEWGEEIPREEDDA